MQLIVSILLNGLVVLLLSKVMPGVHLMGGIWSGIIVGCVIGLINSFIKPIVSTIALPVTVFTLGLFSFVISGLMIMLASYLLDSFQVDNILYAMLFAVALSFVNSFLGSYSFGK